MSSIALSNTNPSWNATKMVGLGFTEQEIAVAENAAAQEPLTSVIDLLVQPKWNGNIPASDQFQIEDLKKREVVHITNQLNGSHDAFVPGIVNIIREYGDS